MRASAPCGRGDVHRDAPPRRARSASAIQAKRGDERRPRRRRRRPTPALPSARAARPGLGRSTVLVASLAQRSAARASRARGGTRRVERRRWSARSTATRAMGAKSAARLAEDARGSAAATLTAAEPRATRLPRRCRPRRAASPSDAELLEKARDASRKLHEAIAVRVVGQEAVIDLMLVALLARGHALLVGVPGLAKTLLVASLAEALDLVVRARAVHAGSPARRHHRHRRPAGGRRRRGQRRRASASCRARSSTTWCSPTRSTARRRRRRPRSSRRCRSGASRSARTTHALPDPFQVFATRNPIEQEGTYPLPEAQLDRFLLEIHVDYPSERRGARDRAADDERRRSARVPRVLGARRRARASGARPAHSGHRRGGGARGRARPRDAPDGPEGARARCASSCASARARAGRRRSSSRPRRAPRCAGEAAADVDDVRALVVPVLRHRLVLSYRAEAEGVRDVDVPRARRPLR